jgi:hypothetical protein
VLWGHRAKAPIREELLFAAANGSSSTNALSAPQRTA